VAKSRASYSTIQIVLHWLVAALVLFQLFFGESMQAVVDAKDGGGEISATDQILGSAHYWIGLIILVLVSLRLAARRIFGAPVPPRSGHEWTQMAARISHWLFYALLVLTPIAGLLAFHVGDPWGDIHKFNKPAFIFLIVIHGLAALYHQFWLKDGTLRRMILPMH